MECAMDGVWDRFGDDAPGTEPPPPPDPELNERFPGDPNPLITGLTYWGQGGANREVATRLNSGTGTTIGIRRRFKSVDDWGSSLPGALGDWADEDHDDDTLPCLSFKVPSWPNAAAGGYDTTLDAIIVELQSKSKPTWVAINHEPENDGSNPSFTNWCAMQAHFRARLNAWQAAHPTSPNRIAFGGILMYWTFNPASGRDPDDWYPGDGVWDWVGNDHYTEASQTIWRTNPWEYFVSWCEARDLPFCVPEWGLRTEDTSRVTKMQGFWDRMLDDTHDCVGFMYYDTDVNSTGTGWEMDSALLTRFKLIMQDSRAMHLSDLGY